jgi:hypothetical protein
LLVKSTRKQEVTVSKSNNRPAIFAKPTLLVPAMADWTPEQVELSREPETLVWEAPKTVVEVPWWLRGPEATKVTKATKVEPLRARRRAPPEEPCLIRDTGSSEDRCDSFDDDTIPTIFSFRPFEVSEPEAAAFEDTLPQLLDPDLEDAFPRQVTSYDVKIAAVVDAAVVDSPFEDTDEVVVPLPRITPRPRVGRLGLLSLLVLALGTLVAATFKVFNLFPRLQP